LIGRAEWTAGLLGPRPDSAVMDPGLDRTVPALILKIGNYPLHHGAVGAIRSLGRAGVSVFAVNEDRLAPARFSRWLTGGFLWQTWMASEPALLEGLEVIAERIGRPAVLIPTDDRAAIFVAEHTNHLRALFRFPKPPRWVPSGVANKLSLAELCRDNGVPCPSSAVPMTRSEAEEFWERAGFPLVAKVVDMRAAHYPSGVRSSTVVHRPEELLALYDQLEASGIRSGLLLQDHIPEGDDWIVHGYCGSDSTLLAGFTGLKVRSWPPTAGLTSLGRCVRNDELLEQAQRLLRRLNYQGILDMDWRLDRRDGRYKLLDFNPRLGAQFRLFETERGVDVVRAAHLDLSGRAVPAGWPADGRTFMVEHYDVLSALSHWRRGALTAAAWRRSVRGLKELAWFDRDDPWPGPVMLQRFLVRNAGRPVGLKPRLPGDKVARTPRYFPGRKRQRNLRPPVPAASDSLRGTSQRSSA
jgi:D-aspartate ligase